MSESEQVQADNALHLAAEIVSAYVSNNSIPVAELPTLIARVHQAILGLAGTPKSEMVKSPKPNRATDLFSSLLERFRAALNRTGGVHTALLG